MRIAKLTGIGLAAVLIVLTGCTEKTIDTSPPRSTLTECEQERRTLEVAAETYNATMEEYPQSVDQLLLPGTTPEGTQMDTLLSSRPKYWVLDKSGNAVKKPGVERPEDC